MAEKLDPKELVTLEELAISNMWEMAALMELLERKGICTNQEVLVSPQRSRDGLGQHDPPPSTVQKLTQALNVTVRELLEQSNPS